MLSGRVPAHETGFGPYTVLDLHDLPEDGKGFELEDGWLIEVAAVEAEAAVIVCDGGDWEITTPTGIRKPDVLVIPREVARAVIIDESPKVIPGGEVLLAAEVVSPGSSSERTDRLRKVGEYATLGIPQYWIVEHQPEPRVQILVLEGGGYSARPVVAAGTELRAVIEADKPFEVSFSPAALLDF
ncbi:Uma2 family endonuclease [Actinomadura macrotermitis]|nr:Uma2 family endonuclease [Actinomadura macrotermitis]